MAGGDYMKHGDDRLRTAAAPFVARGFLSVSRRVQRALALVALVAALVGQSGVAAYDVCADDYHGQGLSCAHEQMFDEAMRFYTELVPSNRFSQEIIAHAGDIRDGVGAPDEGDPIYDNVGVLGALVTITHFFQPDQSIGRRRCKAWTRMGTPSTRRRGSGHARWASTPPATRRRPTNSSA